MKLELKYNINDTVYIIWNRKVYECVITEIKYTNNCKIHYIVKEKDNNYVGNFCEESDIFSNKIEADNKAKLIVKEKLTKDIDEFMQRILSFYRDAYDFEVNSLKFENDKVIIEEI